MAETYPVATTPVTPVVPVVEPLVLTPEDQAALDLLYEELKPQATATAREYVLARTPAEWQVDMAAKIDADWPAPPAMSPEMVASRKRDLESGERRAEVVPAVVMGDPPPGTIANPAYRQ